MYLLGHVGIGVHLIPERLRKPVRWLALGCVLPDLLDKPWWLLMGALHAQQAGTRLFGHTLLFSALLLGAALLFSSTSLRALSLGALTHAALDVAGELAAGTQQIWHRWLLWPLFGWRFPVETNWVPPPVSERSIYFAAEAVGLAFLLLDFIRWRRSRPAPRRSEPK